MSCTIGSADPPLLPLLLGPVPRGAAGAAGRSGAAPPGLAAPEQSSPAKV